MHFSFLELIDSIGYIISQFLQAHHNRNNTFRQSALVFRSYNIEGGMAVVEHR